MKCFNLAFLSATNTYVSRRTVPISVAFLNRHIFIEVSAFQSLHSLFFSFFPTQQNLFCNRKPEIQFPLPPNSRKLKNFANRTGERQLTEPHLGATAGLWHKAFICLQTSAGITSTARSVRVLF